MMILMIMVMINIMCGELFGIILIVLEVLMVMNLFWCIVVGFVIFYLFFILEKCGIIFLIVIKIVFVFVLIVILFGILMFVVFIVGEEVIICLEVFLVIYFF